MRARSSDRLHSCSAPTADGARSRPKRKVSSIHGSEATGGEAEAGSHAAFDRPKRVTSRPSYVDADRVDGEVCSKPLSFGSTIRRKRVTQKEDKSSASAARAAESKSEASDPAVRPKSGAPAQQPPSRRPTCSDLLLRASQAAADWGFKGVQPDTTICPLYYGCPERAEYFCCERHKSLWHEGKMTGASLPATMLVSAPEPPWVLAAVSSLGSEILSTGGGHSQSHTDRAVGAGERQGTDMSGREGTSSHNARPNGAGGVPGSGSSAIRGLQSWVRNGGNFGEEDVDGDVEEGEEEECDDDDDEEGEEGEEGEEDEEDEEGEESEDGEAAEVDEEDGDSDEGDDDDHMEDDVQDEYEEDAEQSETAMQETEGEGWEEEGEAEEDDQDPEANGGDVLSDSGAKGDFHNNIAARRVMVAAGGGPQAAKLDRSSKGVGAAVDSVSARAVSRSHFVPPGDASKAPATAENEVAAEKTAAVPAERPAAGGVPAEAPAGTATDGSAARMTASASFRDLTADEQLDCVGAEGPGRAPTAGAAVPAKVKAGDGRRHMPSQLLDEASRGPSQGLKPASGDTGVCAVPSQPAPGFETASPAGAVGAAEPSGALGEVPPRDPSQPPYARAQQLLMLGADCLLCRAAAVLARTAAHPHAPPFSAPVDLELFPEYYALIAHPMDLRTVAENLSRDMYGFGQDGSAAAAAARLREDVQLIWRNCRDFNPPRATIVRMISPIEAAFNHAWTSWIDAREDDGWREWLRRGSAVLVAVPEGARLPRPAGARKPASRPPRRAQPAAIKPPPPTMTQEEIAALSSQERQQLLESALPGRAPPPPGWDAADVGGCPWHMQPQYLTPAAQQSRQRSEEALRIVLSKRGLQVAQGAPSHRRACAVPAAVGVRVMTRDSNSERVRYGTYLESGRVLDDESKQAMRLCDFALSKHRPMQAVLLVEQPEVSMETLQQLHGSEERSRDDAQADPHCTECGGGESVQGNEILLCDGLRCANSYHQQCCTPPVEEVPEGAWLCQQCTGAGNIIDPQVLEDARRAEEARGGEESSIVVVNDGTGEQDIELLMEMLEVIDSSLPLIGRANAAKLLFSPDHQSLALVRSTDQVRRVLGCIVLKPHVSRGFMEIAFCVVRKEEQRGGIGSRLIERLKEHALALGILHLLTYADDSATGFFERLGFDADPPAGMQINRFHWGISHYIGSQLRQCVLDPDGRTLFSPHYPRRVPEFGRRLPASDAADCCETVGCPTASDTTDGLACAAPAAA